MAPVPVKTLSCDGHTYKCTGELVREYLSSCILLTEVGNFRFMATGTVGRRGVPASSVRPGEGRCELSTLNEMARH